MRRAPLAAVACVLAGMTLAACNGDPPAASSTPPTDTQSATTTADDPGDGQPSPPAMPALAREHTIAGAKAFVKYYVDVLNYSYLNTTSEILDPLSPRPCTTCRAFVEAVDSMERHGGGQTGGEWTTTKIHLLAKSPDDHLLLLAEADVAAGSSTPSKHTQPHKIQAHHDQLEFGAGWKEGSWEITHVSQG